MGRVRASGDNRLRELAKVAALRGERTFDPGRPCMHGHVSPRYVKGRLCVACVRQRPPKTAERSRFDAKNHYWRHRETLLKAQKQKRNPNPRPIKGKKQSQKDYADSHQEQIKERAAIYNNSEQRKLALARFRERNRDRIRKQASAYYRRNRKAVYLRSKERGDNSIRRARRQAATIEPIQPEAIRRILAAARCHICGKPFTTRRPATLDHVIPLAKGGKHVLSNLAAAHGSCNSRKSALLLNPETGQGILL